MANLGEIKLSLKIGVGAAINDSQSAEQPVQILDFLAGVAGFGVLIGGWTPQVPTVKKGGVWADSSISDGRELTAASMGNVVETITLTSIGADMKGRYYLQKELRRYAQMARDFWQTDYQIEPVYLEWWAEGSCAPQYALVYNLDIANQQEAFSAANVGQVVITVEREPYWRAVRPGGHPKEYTFYMRGFLPGVDWTVADLNQETTTGNFAETAWANEHSWNVDKTTHGYQNWLDIPGDLIPGDAPAQVYLTFPDGTDNFAAGYIGRSTKPLSLPLRTGDAAYTPGLQNLSFNAPDATLGVDATRVLDATAGRIRASDQARYYTSVSFATATRQTRITWNGDVTIAAGGEPLSFTLQRGRYMAFLLMSQNGGSTGDISVDCEFQTTDSQSFFLSAVASPGVGALPGWWYMGVVSIPQGQTGAIAAFDGSGLAVGFKSSFDILVSAARTAGAGTLRLYSLTLIPIDECIVYMTGNSLKHLDCTGYLAHGKPNPVALSRVAADSSIRNFPELRGDGLFLQPGVDNRLYFFTPSDSSNIGATYNAQINIVPRWSGARDDCSPLDANGTYGGLAALSDDSDLILLDDLGYTILNG